MMLLALWYFDITVFNIDNIKTCFLSSKSHFSIMSEGSCDTEDWSNDAENIKHGYLKL